MILIWKIISKFGFNFKLIKNFSSSHNALKTALYDFQFLKKGKLCRLQHIVCQYNTKKGIISEHLHTRRAATLFDVSHMGNIKLREKESEFYWIFTLWDIKELRSNDGLLSAITKEDGGIVNNKIITNLEEHISEIVNEAWQHKD